MPSRDLGYFKHYRQHPLLLSSSILWYNALAGGRVGRERPAPSPNRSSISTSISSSIINGMSWPFTNYRSLPIQVDFTEDTRRPSDSTKAERIRESSVRTESSDWILLLSISVDRYYSGCMSRMQTDFMRKAGYPRVSRLTVPNALQSRDTGIWRQLHHIKTRSYVLSTEQLHREEHENCNLRGIHSIY